MVACVEQVPWDEFVAYNVIKQLTAVKLHKVWALLPQFLDKPAEDDVSSFLVHLLVQGLSSQLSYLRPHKPNKW